jgi:predicted translin family RNA/ssDNA-binding protein
MANSSATTPLRLPAPPTPRLTEYGLGLTASLAETKAALQAHLLQEEEKRKAGFDLMKTLQIHTVLASLELRNGRLTEAKAALAAAYEVLAGLTEPIPPQPARPGSVSQLLEEMVTLHAFCHFFETGRLVKFSELRTGCFDDSEYIGGVIGLAQELNQYSVERSMAMDTASVVLCRDLVDALNGQLMTFDFRNGPLRRKFDSVKYALKRQEDLLYEQSLLDMTSHPAPEGGGGQASAKRARKEDDGSSSSSSSSSTSTSSTSSTSSNADADGAAGAATECLVDEAEWQAMRTRYEEADAAREEVIKGCRDGQKLSKLAIYSVHRGQLEGPKGALKQLEDAQTKTAALLPKVEQFPTLRPGAFNNVLEEYAEARLFLHWVTTRQVLPLSEMPLLDPVKDVGAYLGGLVDLTGEIGRIGVAHHATKRDLDGVRECFEATCVVATLLGELPPSGALKKKGGAVATNLRKLGQVRYELALAEKSGNDRRKPSAAMMDDGGAGGSKGGGGGGGGDDDDEDGA